MSAHQCVGPGWKTGSPEHDFAGVLASHGWQCLTPTSVETLQLNIGRLCNQACRHCHVLGAPDRGDEMMSLETIQACLRALDSTGAHTVDITGGAPELHPRFRHLVESAAGRGKHVIDRCNLTVLLESGLEDLPAFLADHRVEVVASLPHYRRRNTDAQRGEGVFDRSIKALRRLNSVGYGHGDPQRRLTLMTNPCGAYLAGRQKSMEEEWKGALRASYSVSFDRLIALNNMPIGRFLTWLDSSGNRSRYMQTLVDSFNPSAVAALMCRNSISISWDGRAFDCDFNQMLDLPADVGDERSSLVSDLELDAVSRRRIRTGPHCFGCTAGAGSSCGGALTA
jgi:radical SAM/Cys-rich protein